MDGYIYIIFFSVLMILSHIFGIIATKYKIPSVILLISTGILSKHILEKIGIFLKIPVSILQMIGTIGLILIVLDGALELEVKKEKIDIMKKSFFLSMIALISSSTIIAFIIMSFYKVDYLRAMLYGIPVSVISSAIVIPSIGGISEEKREFLIYESAFSDILGIIMFNFFAYSDLTTLKVIPSFAVSIVSTILIAIVSSLLLIFILGRTKGNVKVIIILSMLMLLYSIGKFYHLSSLILILVFGLMINNFDKIMTVIKPKEKISKFFNTRNTLFALRELTLINSELAFAIRTVFFFMFGYSFDVLKLLDSKVILIGEIVIIFIYFIRFLSLRIFFKKDIYPEFYVAPRGLITVLLFYAIPERFMIATFNEGILFFIIIITSLLMMFGLLSDNKKK